MNHIIFLYRVVLYPLFRFGCYTYHASSNLEIISVDPNFNETPGEQMAFQTPFLFYEYKTELLCFFKIDHARRQKNNGS